MSLCALCLNSMEYKHCPSKPLCGERNCQSKPLCGERNCPSKPFCGERNCPSKPQCGERNCLSKPLCGEQNSWTELWSDAKGKAWADLDDASCVAESNGSYWNNASIFAAPMQIL